MMTTDTRAGICTCPHGVASHKNLHGRCMVIGCQCLYGPLKAIPTSHAATTHRPSQASKLEALLAHRIELAGLPAPVQQYRWATGAKRQYRSDFAWPDAMLLAEVQGGIWAADPGRHNRGSGYQNDCERSNLAVLLGYRMLTFTEKMIRSGAAVATIEQALHR